MTKFVNATSPSTRWSTETILVSFNRGMFVDVCSILSLQRWAEPRQDKFEINKLAPYGTDTSTLHS